VSASKLVKLRADWPHAELIGGHNIAPGETFERKLLDDESKRLEDEGALIDAPKEG
jgi:hypothetical protein